MPVNRSAILADWPAIWPMPVSDSSTGFVVRARIWLSVGAKTLLKVLVE